MNSRTEITVSAWTVVKIILCILLFWAVFYLRDIILLFLTAVIIASAVEAGADWFVRRGWPRVLVVVLIYVLVAALLGLFSYFILPPLLADMSDLLATLPKYGEFKFLGEGANFSKYSTAFQGLMSGMPLSQIASGVSSALNSGSAGFFQTVTTIFGGAWGLVLIIILSFYLSAQKDGVEKFLRLISPQKNEEQVVKLLRSSQRLIARWIQGQLLLGLMVGVLVYLGLLLLGVRHALLLAFVSALLELIPVFGPIFGAVPGIAIGLLDGGVGKGLIVAALYIFIQQMESNVIYPLVVKKIVGVPPLVVILALLVGYELGGFLGVILAVPLAAVALEIIYTLTQKPIQEGKVELIK